MLPNCDGLAREVLREAGSQEQSHLLLIKESVRENKKPLRCPVLTPQL